MEKVTLTEKLPILEPNENNIKYTKEVLEYFKNKMYEIGGIKLEHKDINYGEI